MAAWPTYSQLMLIESVVFFMAKQGFLMVVLTPKHDSSLTSLVITQASKEKSQGNPAKRENQSG